ncbi:MAG: hypothetical protein WAN16_10320 [Chthoniobacterales bacterium]
MDPFLFRIIRSFIMGIIMFFSVKSLGFTASAATIAALIPLLLGVVDVMSPTAYGITAIIFILAVIVHVFPDQYEEMKKMAGDGLSEVHARPTPQPALPSTAPTNTAVIKQ